jgi:hypothetical protein
VLLTDFLHLGVSWPLVDRPLINDLGDISETNILHGRLTSQCNVHWASKLLASFKREVLPFFEWSTSRSIIVAESRQLGFLHFQPRTRLQVTKKHVSPELTSRESGIRKLDVLITLLDIAFHVRNST